jgi:hypothetical protein
MGWGDVRYCFAMAILVTSPPLLSGDVLLFYFSLLLLLLFLLFFFHTFLSAREVVLSRVDFFKMAAVAMETPKC